MYKLKNLKAYVLFLGIFFFMLLFISFAFLFVAQQQENIAIGGFRYQGRDGDRVNKFTVGPGGAAEDYAMNIVITNVGHTKITLTRLEVENGDRIWTSGTNGNWKVAVYLDDDETLLNPKGSDFSVTIPATRFFVGIKLYCEGSGNYFLTNSLVEITVYSATGNMYRANFFIN
ncbi:MAG: hypothetical protein ACFFCD_14330 [Promethearchaeota archaeon]